MRTFLLSLSSLLVAVLLMPQRLDAQTQATVEEYKFDIGGGFGMSGYLGDANESNLLAHPGFVGDLSFRYLVNSRWAFRAQFTTASLSGSTADMKNYLPEGKVYEFSSQLFDLGLRAEFNFFNYGIGESYKQLSRITPYLALGIGATMSTSGGETFFAPSLPMSFGVKYKLKPRLNLALEFTMTKVFGDNLDSGELQDLYQIKSSFIKNTDWFSALTLSISYEFGKRCVVCHRID